MALYELSIIDEEALMKWKEDVNDAYPGKGQALFQVNLTFRKYLNLYFNIESKLIGMIRWFLGKYLADMACRAVFGRGGWRRRR